jgi:hypothetical protein
MLRYLIYPLLTLSISLGETDDWKAVPSTEMTRFDFDLEAHPLEIKAKPETFDLFFEGPQNLPAGGLSFVYAENKFQVLYCNKKKAPTTPFCRKAENIWRITKVGSTRIEVTCNGDAWLNFEFSNANCDEDSAWADTWTRPTLKIKFGYFGAIATRIGAPADNKNDDNKDKEQLSGANRDRGSFGFLATVFIAGATLWGF